MLLCTIEDDRYEEHSSSQRNLRHVLIAAMYCITAVIELPLDIVQAQVYKVTVHRHDK